MKISDVTSTRGYTYKYDIPYYPYFWYIFRELTIPNHRKGIR